DDLFRLGPADLLPATLRLGQSALVRLGILLRVQALLPHLLRGQVLRVATQDDVGPTAGHVGGDRHRTAPAGLGDDLRLPRVVLGVEDVVRDTPALEQSGQQDRKSTRLNSSHVKISYAVFCLKKKKKNKSRMES